jgi:hypothetical protein
MRTLNVKRAATLRASHSIIVFWWSGKRISLSSLLTNDDGSDVDAPDNSSDNTVQDRAPRCVAGELEAQSAVDDTEGYDDATKPDVTVGEASSLLESLEVRVVEEAQDGLEEDGYEEDYADDRVGFSDLSEMSALSVGERKEMLLTYLVGPVVAT